MSNSFNTDKNVYILGAGFSKEIGLPLQDNFLLVAKEVYFRNTGKYSYFKNVFEYQEKLSKMKNFLHYPLLNLEHLFNLLEMDIFYSKKTEVTKIKDDFLKLIKDVLIELTPNPISYDNTNKLMIDIDGHYKRFLKFLNLFIKDDTHRESIKIHQDTVISLNYDLIFEITTAIYNLKRAKKSASSDLRINILFGKENILIKGLSQFFSYPISEKYFSTQKMLVDVEPSIKLIKLHGSINWERVQNGKMFIIPPTWNKSDKTVRKLWEIAYKELMTAKRIIIIGYSFPEIDIYVKSLIALALNENKIIQNIFFINPDTEDVKERCLSFLDKDFKNHCEYKPWTFSQLLHTPDGELFIKEHFNRNLRLEGSYPFRDARKL